ncbi:unnamed protein product [Ilex paraguariensis]|uniref:Uncharacterized protein n=1 Tax=Ilex paraguariensis TaxID=185542 RepID=A0ABC8SD64_9AQUA
MPVSGNEEPGIITRQSSNSSAGIPIKKRKFPLIGPASPLPQELSTLSVESDKIQNQHSNPSQELSLSNVSDPTNSPTKSVVSKNSFTEVKKETNSPARSDASKSTILEVKQESLTDTNFNYVPNKVNLSRDTVQEPTLTICSSFVDNIESNEKFMQAGKYVSPKAPASTELHLPPNEVSALYIGSALSKQQVERDSKLDLSTVPGNVLLSLGLKEPCIPVLTSQKSEVSHQIHDKLDPSSLGLHLRKENPITQCKSSDDNLNNHSRHGCGSRSNWDLNTTMDAWEGSLGDAAIQGHVYYDVLNATRGGHDKRACIGSTGMAGIGVDTGKQSPGVVEHRSNFPSSSFLPNQQYKSEDSLHLSLGVSFCQPSFTEKQSGSSAKADSGRNFPNANLLGVQVSTVNMDSVGVRAIKSEPLNENAKQDCLGVGGNPMGLDIGTIKQEMVERCNTEAAKLLSISSHKLVEHRSIKSEPVPVGIRATSSMIDNNSSSTRTVPLAPFPTCSELSTSGEIPVQSEHLIHNKVLNSCAPQKACGSGDQTAAETVSFSVGPEHKESNVSGGMINSCRAEDLKGGIPEMSRVEQMDELPLDSCGNGGGSVSDEEKISISADMLEEEDSYDTNYESDGNHAFVTPGDIDDRQCNKEDDEFEDGEVREPLVHSAVEGPSGEVREAENIDVGDCDTKTVDCVGFPGGSNSSVQSHLDENDSKMVDPGKREDHIQDCAGSVCSEIVEKGVDEDGSLHEQLTGEVAASGSDEKRPTIQIKPLGRSGRKETQEGHEKNLSADGATNGSQGTVTMVGQATDESVKGTDMVEKTHSTLPNTEPPLNDSDAAKDANSGGNRSRIINLPRASNLTSPYQTRSIAGRFLTSQTGRERYSEFDGDKLHPRGNRDEFYADGPHKFVRNRSQDLSFRNYRRNFIRGRGRGSSRLDNLCSEWRSDHNFPPGIYNRQADYRFPRHKRASVVADAELECNGYDIVPDGAVVGSGRGGRKSSNDELPSVRHLSSRRLSPGGRDGPAPRSIHRVGRIPRNMSPSRCTGEDGSDLVGLGHEEKYMRCLPNDFIDPVFTRRQPPYEGLDDQFARGNRDFSVQRRGLPRFRSKSPVRSRPRSPGPWSSPRRRSPDGFTGPPELTQRRSPAIYRIERMRSPNRACFPEQIVGRRRGSPPYVTRSSNLMRDMDSERDHGNLRSVIPNRRSPPDRGLPRSSRRFDSLDPRERVDNDDYFGGPIRTGRFHEFGADGSVDERKKLCERRGLVRSFRPPYNGDDGENFHFQVDDGSRPRRFCPEPDPDFVDRNSLRVREFDRPFKNRPTIASRRMRGMEEQEGNYRHGGQGWNDDGFDDMTEVKRRRF